jgi:heme exporter protein C
MPVLPVRASLIDPLDAPVRRFGVGNPGAAGIDQNQGAIRKSGYDCDLGSTRAGSARGFLNIRLVVFVTQGNSVTIPAPIGTVIHPERLRKNTMSAEAESTSRIRPSRLKVAFHSLGSPQRFYRLSHVLVPWLGWLSAILFAVGLYGGLVLAPPDYQQGDSYRIIFIHVPAAWMSMFCYAALAVCGAITLIWRMKLADVVARATAPIGASFTLIALFTGSIWGKPMWGTWWVWDARLTSELILLFLYLGFMALQAAIEDRRNAARAAAVLAVVGVVNLPIIHYSVEWWNTLHQGATITKFGAPSIAMSMLIPLLIMFVAFKTYYFSVMLIRARGELLVSEQRAQWVHNVISDKS